MGGEIVFGLRAIAVAIGVLLMREHIGDTRCRTAGARTLIEDGREIASGSIIDVVGASGSGCSAASGCYCRLIARSKACGCGGGVEIARAVVGELCPIYWHQPFCQRLGKAHGSTRREKKCEKWSFHGMCL